MLETITDWLMLYKDYAPYAVFILLLLTGCSIPISEDVLVIASGVIAGSALPEKTTALFLAAFLGSLFSDVIAYWMGRLLAKRAKKKGSCFGVSVSSDFTRQFENYFAKWGLLTLMIGRLIPFGFRNGIFMTAGAGRMHFGKFIISDGISCFIFSALVFWLSYHSSSGGQSVESWLFRAGLITFFIVTSTVSLIAVQKWKKKRSLGRGG